MNWTPPLYNSSLGEGDTIKDRILILCIPKFPSHLQLLCIFTSLYGSNVYFKQTFCTEIILIDFIVRI